MPSVLAIVSKAVFQKLAPQAAPGSVLGIDRFASTHAALEPLREGGALFLVTVRPPDEALWLVGVLEQPERQPDGWHAASSKVAVTDVSALRSRLRFASGAGITAKSGALAMSLQTPRTLSDADVALLREAIGGGTSMPARPVPATTPAPRATKPAPTPRVPVAPPARPTTKPARKQSARARRDEPARPVATSAPAGFDAISAALDANDGGAALLAALEAWRATRSPALADLIDAISARIAAPAITRDVEWAKVAATRDPLVIGSLLPAIPDLPVSFLPRAGELLAAFPDDPRIAKAVATWALDPPTTSSSTYPFWTRTLDAVARIGDRRAIGPLAQRLAMPPAASKMSPRGSTKPSQFWAKFYTALERVIAALERAPAPAAEAAPIVRDLAGRIATLEVVDAALPVLGRGREPAPKVDGPPLAQALAHATAGRVLDAIDALLVAWRVCRAPELADLIDRANRLLPAHAAAFPIEPKVAAAAWQAAFDADPIANLPALLHHVNVGGAAAAVQHVIDLATLPDDPRIALRLAEVAPRFDISPERTQYWKSLWETIARTRDVRTCDPLRRNFSDFTGTYYDHHRQGRRLAGPFVLDPGPTPTLDAGQHALVNQIAAALAAVEASGDRTERELLAAIAADFEQIGPRLVYADWLTEREHPRGEAIVLSCKASPSQAERKRLAALLGGFRVPCNVYGPFHAFAIVLEHGLPARLKSDFQASSITWRHLAGHPLLPFVELIDVSELARPPRQPLPEDLARVLLDPAATRLTRVTGVPSGEGDSLLDTLPPLLGKRWKRTGKDLVRA
jgi:uncharacterized protein (TIGR02996 family)